MTYVQNAQLFYTQYTNLQESEKTNFSRIINKLQNVNYITSQKESDSKDYYFISSQFDLFKAYLNIIDCDLTFDTANHVIILNSLEGVNRLNLRLNESIILLILRLLYDETMREVSLNNKVMITLETIHDKFLSIGLQDRRISKTELKQILSLFRRYNLIDILDKDYKDDNSRVILYPSLLYAVRIEDINDIYSKIMTYEKGVGNHEEISED